MENSQDVFSILRYELAETNKRNKKKIYEVFCDFSYNLSIEK